MIKLSFIIPCYGSELTIQAVVNELRQTVISRDNYDYEIILVNDSSPDNVYDAVKRVKPDCVDVSSGVEKISGPGKDRDKIFAFVKNARRD